MYYIAICEKGVDIRKVKMATMHLLLERYLVDEGHGYVFKLLIFFPSYINFMVSLVISITPGGPASSR